MLRYRADAVPLIDRMRPQLVIRQSAQAFGECQQDFVEEAFDDIGHRRGFYCPGHDILPE